MNKYTPDPAVKKVKYITSIIYLLVFSFIVGGTYINNQKKEEIELLNKNSSTLETD
jgi:hypothetical protein